MTRVLEAAQQVNLLESAHFVSARHASLFLARNGGVHDWTSLTVAALLGYSWLPQGGGIGMHDFDFEEQVVDILGRTDLALDLDLEDIAELSRLFKGQLPPTSLVLHFLNPDRYAFFDARVCRFLTGGDAVDEEVYLDLELYVQFLDRMHALANSIQAAQLVSRVREHYPATPRLQAINLTMLEAGARL